MKIAVIGSGAAAAGVLAGLARWAPAGADITVFDIGERLPGFEGRGMSEIYGQLRAEHGLAFPPPKSHFGHSLRKLPVAEKPRLWKSEHRGGLTNVWGGGMFPFTDRELAGWPFTAAELDPYYALIASNVGVCGEPDELNRYFARDYVNRPPLRTSPVIDALARTVNRGGATRGDWRIVAGSSRLALETRAGHDRACDYRGECMLGCPREAIWSATHDLDRHEASGLITRTVIGRVRKVVDRRVHVDDAIAGPFDRVYLAAGCIGSTEIVMRSLGIERGPALLDNAVLSFPIFYAGAAGGLLGDDGRYFSLCNLSMMGIPVDPTEAAAQVSVYPAFDHLWRYYTPEPLWNAMKPLWRLGRWRLLLGRVFLAGAANRSLDFTLEDDRLVLRDGRAAASTDAIGSFMRSLRRTTNRSGFVIPPLPPGGHGTSSHYAATFPYGGPIVDLPRSGSIAPGVHLADASTFVDSPAISPTFTIMANACRTVHESLQD